MWCDETSLSPIWRVNGYKMNSGAAAFTPVLADDNDLTEHEIKGGAIRYGWRECDEGGQTVYQVRAEVITGPCCPEECRDLCARKNVKLTLAE